MREGKPVQSTSNGKSHRTSLLLHLFVNPLLLILEWNPKVRCHRAPNLSRRRRGCGHRHHQFGGEVWAGNAGWARDSVVCVCVGMVCVVVGMEVGLERELVL